MDDREDDIILCMLLVNNAMCPCLGEKGILEINAPQEIFSYTNYFFYVNNTIQYNENVFFLYIESKRQI